MTRVSNAQGQPSNVGWQSLSGDGYASLQWSRGGISGVAALAPPEASGARRIGIGRVRRRQLEIRLQGARPAAAILKEDRLVYADVFPSTDVILITDEASFEELWLLKDSSSPTRFVWSVVLPEGITHIDDDRDGGLLFSDARHHPILKLPPPFAIDARGQSRAVQIRREGSEITFTLDPTGLVYPVLVDPGLVEVASWAKQAPALSPEPRGWHSMAWLAPASAVVMHGGFPCSNSTFANPGALWAWKDSSWSEIVTSAVKPPARGAESMIGLSGSLVLFGGHDSTGAVSGDEWVYSPGSSSWAIAPTTNGPSARSGMMSAASSGGDSFLTYGGGDYSPSTTTALSDSYFAKPWALVPTPGGPPVRDGVLLQVPELNTYLLWGGRTCASSSCSALVEPYALQGQTWGSIPTPHGGTPAPRSGVANAYDSVRKRHVIYGGADGNSLYQDTWEFTGKRWYQRAITAPTTASFAAMAFDPVRNQMVLFGGRNNPGNPGENPSDACLGETWVYTVSSDNCTLDSDCDTGHCVDGACCEQAACEPCFSCNTPFDPGYCTAIADQGSCAGAAGSGGSGAGGAGGTGTAGTSVVTGGAGGSSPGSCPNGQRRYDDNRCYDPPNEIDPHGVLCECDLARSTGRNGRTASQSWAIWLSVGAFVVWLRRRSGSKRERRSRLGSTWGTWLIAGVGVIGIAGCDTPLGSDEPCKNAFYAVASRTHACTGDADLANRRHDEIEKKYVCIIEGEPTLKQFLCTSAINNLTCDQVIRYGDDYDSWMVASDTCDLIFRHADGSHLPRPIVAGGNAGTSGTRGTAPTSATGETTLSGAADTGGAGWAE